MNIKIGWMRQKSISASVRFNQLRYRGKTNSPYLSGDVFANLCDLTFPKHDINSTAIKQAQTIFCQSDYFDELLTRFGDVITAHTIVLGNSDRDFYEFNYKVPASIRKIFLQNSHLTEEKFEVLPIGLENLRFGRNGLVKYFPEDDYLKPKKNSILVGPFSPTHSERNELLKWEGINDSGLTYIDHYLTPKILSAISSSHRFVACPRGNGTDTHRFWETLYRGSIPVVKESLWSYSIKQLGIPLVELSEWSYEEFLYISQSNDYEMYNPISSPKLWSQYWEKIINSNPE